RTWNVVGEHFKAPAGAIEAIKAVRYFLFRLVPLVVAEQTERRIGEPDAVVGFHDDVVRRVEALALEAIGENGDRPVVLGAGDATPPMLAGHEPALAVARV